MDLYILICGPLKEIKNRYYQYKLYDIWKVLLQLESINVLHCILQ